MPVNACNRSIDNFDRIVIVVYHYLKLLFIEQAQSPIEFKIMCATKASLMPNQKHTHTAGGEWRPKRNGVWTTDCGCKPIILGNFTNDFDCLFFPVFLFFFSSSRFQRSLNIVMHSLAADSPVGN